MLKVFKFTGYLLKNSTQVFVFRITGVIFAYLIMILITNYFGAEIYGRYTISITLLQFAVLLFAFGIPTAIVKLTSDKVNFDMIPKNDYLKKALISVLISSVIGGVILFLLSSVLSNHIFNDEQLQSYFEVLSYSIVFLVFHSFVMEFLRGREKFQSFAIGMYILPYLIFLFFLVIVIYFDLKESYLLLSYILGLSLTGILYARFLPFGKLKSSNTYNLRALYKLSFPMLITAAFIFLINWTDVFMLGAMVSKEELGIYNVAFKLATVALIVIHTVNTIIGPKIARYYSENKIGEMENLIKQATKIITLLTFPVVIVLIVFRNFFLGIFGIEFVNGDQALIIISLGLLFNALSGSVSQVLNMTKHQNELRNITLIAALLNIIFNLILIPTYGIKGAALASLIANVFLNVSGIIMVKHYLNFYTFFSL